ncbi:hypothetical protein K1719_039188 [Acacia pycnantha]|nr:hypothetical protein K1719_039188 [Acacia pycnantha]
MGYYKDTQSYDKYINLKGISELSKITKDETGIEIGATVTIFKAIEALKPKSGSSVGANLVMAQKYHFPSDIATILLAVDTMVHIMTSTKFEWLTMQEFLERLPLELESVLLSIKIPCWESSKRASPKHRSKIFFETFRASPRPLGNALPYLNAAFVVEVSTSEDYEGIVLIDNCRLSFGAYGARHAVRAKEVEELLKGKLLNFEIIHEATNLLTSIVVAEDGTSDIAYRSSLAIGFLYKFYSPLIDHSVEKRTNYSNGKVLHDNVHPILLSGKQEIQVGDEHRPIGEPVTKSGATLQASGEAVYVDDIPSSKNYLHGAYIIAQNLWQDIDPLFADEVARCIGDRIAFAVADTQKLADMAANSAIVEYDFENLETPILSVEEAVERSSLFEIYPMLYPQQVGDLTEGMAEAEHKILSSEIKLGSQYYFYIETQAALAVPDEDSCLTVYSSSQAPELLHSTIATCLNIHEHNVRTITRRVGGGFGGKFTKAHFVATSCAVAAHKLRRPVRVGDRMYMNHKTDMIMAGGRHPMKITYDVGFKSNGKIIALELKILVDAGIDPDLSIIMPHAIIGALKKYDWGVLSFDIKLCRTNLPSRSAMRGPGEVQGSYIAEAIIENVASTLSIDVDSVRSINIHTYKSLCTFYNHSAGDPIDYTLASIWNKLAVSARYNQRSESVKEFNKNNIWKKRGISRVPALFEVQVRHAPGKTSILKDGSVAVEVGDLLDKVRVIQSDTLSLIQGGMIAGSTTSESSCEAVRLSCNVLVERLIPLKEKLQKEMGSINWKTLISQAHLQGVNLSENSIYYPGDTTSNYLNYGVAMSEVEIDLLTGETSVLQTDIIYDCGKSLNPAVDLGQIEGAFVQGLGFFMLEEYETNHEGLVLANGTWNYKIPTLDTIPKQFNVEIVNSGHHKHRVLSSKASGEPPLLLAAGVHCATRAAVKEARKQLLSWSNSDELEKPFQLDVPVTMPVVKRLCGLDIVERYLKWKMGKM